MKIVSDLAFLEARFKRRTITWTRKREEELRDLWGIGLDPAIIGVEMGLDERTISRRLAVLGLRPSAYKWER